MEVFAVATLQRQVFNLKYEGKKSNYVKWDLNPVPLALQGPDVISNDII